MSESMVDLTKQRSRYGTILGASEGEVAAELAIWDDARKTLKTWARLHGSDPEKVDLCTRQDDCGLWVKVEHGVETLFWGRRHGYRVGTLGAWFENAEAMPQIEPAPPLRPGK